MNVFDHITKLALGSTRIGQVPFGPFDRATVLQALVNHATSGLSKISRSAAVQLVADANAAHEPVGYVNRASIHVRFDRDSFDPSSYDAANGGFGTARRRRRPRSHPRGRHGPGFVESN